MIEGERSAVFRFPHLPSDPFWLEDLGEPRFAAARACRLTAEDAGPGSPWTKSPRWLVGR